MNRYIVFAALLSGIGLGAWSSFSGPLAPPGLDFGALASTLKQYLGPRSMQAPASASASLTQQGWTVGKTPILLNAALDAGEFSDMAATSAWREPDHAEPVSQEGPCGAWSISDTGMEAILREMISRGWTPPARSTAIAPSQPVDRPPIEALEPDSPSLAILSNGDDLDGDGSPNLPSN